MAPRERFRLRGADVCVAGAAVTLLGMLFSPVLAQTIDDARRRACMNNCKQIVLGLLNHESAKMYYPAASTASFDVPPGNEVAPYRAAYSWHTLILPFMEQAATYTRISSASDRFEKSGFVSSAPNGEGEIAVATFPVEPYLCPAFAGKPVVDVSASDYKSADDAGGAPALTNYFATSATHLVERGGMWGLAGTGISRVDEQLEGNGAIPFFSSSALIGRGERAWTKLRGTTMASIRDGSSNTFFFCESREQAYAAWIDGQASWVVTAWPQNPSPPRLQDPPAPPGSDPSDRPVTSGEAPDVLGWDAGQLTDVTGPLAKQRYGTSEEEAGVYLPDLMWSGTRDRKYGPSGNHPGVAMHAFVDGRVVAVKDSIDPTIYLHLTTRAGQELVDGSAL